MRYDTLQTMTETPRVTGIYTSPAKGQPMVSHDSILAIEGQGLDGDRYASRTGAWSHVRIPDDFREVTIFSSIGLEEANREFNAKGIQPFSADQLRRNIQVNIPVEKLNQVGRERAQIRIGEHVIFEATTDCAPCKRPPTLLNRSKDGVLFEEVMKDRGGIRFRVIQGGQIKLDDEVHIINPSN